MEKVGNNEGFRLFELQYPVRRTGTPQDVANMISFYAHTKLHLLQVKLLLLMEGYLFNYRKIWLWT